MKGVADRELHFGAVDEADLDLGKEATAGLQPEHDVETAPDVGAVARVGRGDHERRAAAEVDGPGLVPEWHMVGKFEVDGEIGEAVADSDLNVRPEGDVVGDRPGLEVPAEDKLVRIATDAGADADARLGPGRRDR